MKRGFFGFLLATALPTILRAAPVPAGPEFQINVDTVGSQRHPAVCVTPGGDFVVVWTSSPGVVGRRFDRDGVALGGEFTINTSVPQASLPAVACDAAGAFVAVWEKQDGSNLGLVGRRFDANGSPVAGEFQVNTYTTGYQYRHSVSMSAGGEFVVAWKSEPPTSGSYRGIMHRRWDASGVAQGPEQKLSDQLVLDAPGVSSDATGNFVVVWQDFDVDGYAVVGRRFAVDGTPLGARFDASARGEYTGTPHVSSAPDGSFVIAWKKDNPPDGTSDATYASRFDANGLPLGGEFQVDDASPFGTYQSETLVAADAYGDFVVVWTEYGQDDDPDYSIWGRAFAGGTPRGGQFMVNTYTTGFQGYPASVASDAQGNFVVVWHSPQDGDEDGIFGQRYAAGTEVLRCSQSPRPSCKQSTVVGNGLLLIRDRTPDSRDLLSWTWARGEATDFEEFGDPLTTNAYVLCLYDETGARPYEIAHSRAPAGGTCGTRPCWKASSTGYKYVNGARTPDGLKKLQLKAGVAGRAQAKAAASGDLLDPPSLPLALPARVQLQAGNGTCFEATYDTGGVIRNTDIEFRGQPG
jgi:hypothetical protein